VKFSSRNQGLADTNTSLKEPRLNAVAALPPRRSHLRLGLQAGLATLDTVALASAILLVGTLWLGKAVDSTGGTIDAALVGFYTFLAANAGAFSSRILSRWRHGVFLAMRSVLVATASVMVAAFFLKADAQISRMLLIVGGIAGSLLVGGLRFVYHRIILDLFGTDLYSEVLIIDDLIVPPPPGVHVIDAKKAMIRSDLSDPIMLDRLGRLLSPIDRVVVACPVEKRRSWSMMLKCANIQAEIISPELNELGPLAIGEFGESATVIVAISSLDIRQRIIKRSLDILLSVLAIVILGPLLLVVSAAVKLDSPGPVLFVQDRVGRGNRLFGICKFRSMRVESNDREGASSTKRGDSRMTKVGRFIRATSIDELPQIFNVLRGQMSVVGPRPHALGSLAGDMLFWEVDERYWHRHVCKPGMTGLAQVRGFRGATNVESDLKNRLQADLEYVSNWTVFRDISILIATLRVVVHRNAY